MLTDTVKHPVFAGQGTAQAYGAALRHSARVRRMKIILPVLAALIAAAFFAVSFIASLLPDNLAVDSATIENGKIVMQNPAISGRNNQGISYSMRAARALQDVADPNMITLETIHAEMPVNDTLVATVDASSGIYNRGGNTLDMNAPFTISLNNGVNADFESAYMDVTAGWMETKRPIAISMKGGSIVAQSLRMTDKGRVVLFDGMVRVNIEPSAIRKTRE